MGKLPGDVRGRFDARGQKAERLSTYFHPSNAQLPVRRFELEAILDRIEQVRHYTKWYRRLWRFLLRPLDSKPHVIAPTKGEIARGEITRDDT